MLQVNPAPSADGDAYSGFMAAYGARDYDAASRIFLTALDAEPARAYRIFAGKGSGQLAEVLHNSRRADYVVRKLDQLLAAYPHINILGNPDPDVTKAIAVRREENIDKGLPSIVVVTQGKSGSVSVGNIFNSGYRLPSVSYSLVHLRVIDSWARDYARGGCCQVTHLDPDREQAERLTRAGIRKVIVHVRDPRQALVSMVHHLDRYPDQLVGLKALDSQGGSVSQRAMKVIPYYSHTIRWISNWVALENDIAILFSTFEKMVSNWDAFIDQYVAFYGGFTKYFSKKSAETRHASLDYHFRSGRPDEWREVFSKEEAEYLSSLLPQKLKDRFGWPD